MLKPTLAAHFQTYADCHRHPINRLTHKIAIPFIVFHVVAMLDWVPLIVLPGSGVTVTLLYPVLVAVIGWYATLHVRLAVVMTLLYGICIPLGWLTPRPVVIVLAIVAWLIQLAGHSIWEKSRPAFFTNLLQALVGPLFFAAVLLGYWPERESKPSSENSR